jgi:hypothetical protein
MMTAPPGHGSGKRFLGRLLMMKKVLVTDRQAQTLMAFFPYVCSYELGRQSGNAAPLLITF